MSNNLYLKYHGLPGIGVRGVKGLKGENGNLIYFGFINDFFDGSTIMKDNEVRVASRSGNVASDISTYIKDFANKNGVDESISNAYVKYILESKTYYTGVYIVNNDLIVLDADSDHGQTIQLFSDGSLNEDVNGVVKIGDNLSISKFVYINNASINNLPYYKTYNYTETGEDLYAISASDGGLTYDIINNQPYITYEPEDAGNYDEYRPDNKQYILNSSYYTYIDGDLIPIDDEITLDFVPFVKEAFNVDDNSNGILNLTSTRQHYISDLSTYTITYYGDNLKYMSNDPENVNTSLYARNAIIVENGEDYDPEEFIIDPIVGLNINSYRYYGISYDSLYNEDGQLKDKSTILLSIKENNPTLAKYENLNSAVEDYLYRIDMVINPYTDLSTLHITWIEDDEYSVFIPTTLKEDFKVGDTLYFYTDMIEYLEGGENKITNMVVLTEDLLGCNVNALISNSTALDPLSINFFTYNGGDLVYTSNNIISLTSCDTSIQTSLEHFSNMSLCNIISLQTSGNIILTSFNDSSNFIICNAIDSSDGSMCINNDGIINSSKIKIENLYVNNDIKESNIETYDSIYADNIKLLSDGFVQPLLLLSEYRSDTGTIFLGLTLEAKNYFKDPNNLTCYAYGYEIYNNDGLLVTSNITNNISCLMYLPTEKYVVDASSIVITNPVETANEGVTIQLPYDIVLYHNEGVYTTDWDNVIYSIGEYVNLNTYIIAKNDRVSRKINGDYILFDSSMYGSQDVDKIETVKLFYRPATKLYYTYAKYDDRLQRYVYDIEKTNLVVLDAIFNGNVKVTAYLSVEYLIHLFTINTNGIKHYSKATQVSCHMMDKYILDYKLDIIDDNNNTTENTNYGDIIFTTSSVKCDSSIATVNIETLNNDITIGSIYFNNKICSSSTSAGVWNITKDSNYNYTITMPSNVPNGGSLYDYMASLHDTSTSTNGDSLLFAMLANGESLPSTLDRSLLITVEYTKKGTKEKLYETYNLKLPGFTDYRDIPTVNINMHNDMESIQKYNSIENGVLCNQFVTYMDVTIPDIIEKWGQHLDADSSISIDIELSNIANDLDIDKKYNIQNIVRRNTIKVIPDENYRKYVDNNTEFNNYVMLSLSCDDDDVAIDNSIYIQTKKNAEGSEEFKDTFEDNNKKYVLLNAKVTESLSKPYYIFRGINSDFTIGLNNITIDKAKDFSKRFKILFEIGNPLITSLYLRFIVSSINVHYYVNEVEKAIFKATIPENKIAGNSKTVLYEYNSLFVETYKYISSPLDVTINPVSYTVAPTSAEKTLTNIAGVIKKVGSTDLIKKSISLYTNGIYKDASLMSIPAENIRENGQFDWNFINPKLCYIQEDVADINVTSIDLDTTLNILDNEHKNRIEKVSPALLESKNSLDLLNGNKYLSIVYHSNIMNPALRESGKTFFYNAEELLSSKYDLINNNYPIFANLDAKLLLRTQELLDSMNEWNNEYLNSNKNITDLTYTGTIHTYGNGYMCLKSSADYGQWGDSILSLYATKLANNVKLGTMNSIENVNIKPSTKYEPEVNKYYRTFLYNMKWEYPLYDNNSNVYPYQIASDFDLLLKYSDGNRAFDYTDKADALSDYIIPYNNVFDISPRVAYNTDYNKLHVFMLRKPTICNDNDTLEDIKCYSLSKRYFELTDGQLITELQIPYNVKK